MSFAEVILKNLLRRKTRSALTVAGLAAAVGATTSLLSIAWSFASCATEYYASRKVDLVVVRAGVAERITSSLNAALGAELSSLPEIAEVDGSLTEMVSLGEQNLVGIPLHGLDPRGFAGRGLTIAAGRALEPGDRHAVLLGTNLARVLGKTAGETVDVEGTTFRIVGLFQTENVLEAHTAAAPLADVQELMGRPGQVSEFQVRVARGIAGDAGLRPLCDRIEGLRDAHGQLFGFKALPTRQFVDSDTETRLAAAMAWGTSTIVVSLSIVGMLNTMLMSVLERTKELGILRAIGWTRARIMRLILGESIVVGLSASAIGVATAAAFVRLLAGWSFTRNFVQPNLSPSAAATGVVIMLAAGLLGSFYPAYRGATVLPTESLRFD
jgi:putative ABC transport system permease protein